MQSFSQPGELALMRYGSPMCSPDAVMLDSDVSNITYEEEVADIMGQLLMEHIDAKSAVSMMETMCIRRARDLKWVFNMIASCSTSSFFQCS